jgi:hypothetical protein
VKCWRPEAAVQGLRIPQKSGNLAEQMLASRERVWFMDRVAKYRHCQCHDTSGYCVDGQGSIPSNGKLFPYWPMFRPSWDPPSPPRPIEQLTSI